METLKYIIEDSTIAEVLGIQNFSTDEAAILELVKNAYDANALNLKILFKDNEIHFVDDGIGMNKEDINKHWMHVGKSSKQYKIIDENNTVRIQTGSKGIGRFALARLGSEISIQSKKKDSKGIIWRTDWNTSILEEKEDINDKGTKIIIIGLRERWNTKRIDSLKNYLDKMYYDTAMNIQIIANNYNEVIIPYFPEAKPGVNCRSNIILKYSEERLTVKIKSDEFEKEVVQYCNEININNYETQIDIAKELRGNTIAQMVEGSIEAYLKKIGEFSANFFFNMNSTKREREKFLYKYLNTSQQIESGIVLYRNAFSIASYEGKKDWLGLGKRSRKSPAAASHPTGSWRVRENQMAGYVLIDKEENKVLQDMSNRQGLNENIYYQLFIEIVLIGIKEFERYRQEIIRNIAKNKSNDTNQKDNTMQISEIIIKNPISVKKFTNNQANKLANEIKNYKNEGKKYKKDKEEIEARYKYDVRILNTLATTGLKASSIAHEMQNDRNIIYDNYQYIVDALKEYNMWDELNTADKKNKSYKNVPYLLEKNDKIAKKLTTFMDTMLTKIERKKFERTSHSIIKILDDIKQIWERDYAYLNINILVKEDITYQISEDVLQVILDNLILNSVQQNESRNRLSISIEVNKENELLNIIYKDNGKGLDNKYSKNPRKILEVHETTRQNGHGLGMWIINNTCIMSGGEIKNIEGNKGFLMQFTIGGSV